MDYSEIVDADLCIGCGLCVGQGMASRMEYGSKGFLEPTGRGDSRVDVRTLCGGSTLNHRKQFGDDSIWGACSGVFIANSLNAEVRYSASSGGVVSSIALALLDSKLVDGVIHVVPNDDDPLDNRARISKSSSDILQGASSRYAPATVLHLLTSEMLESGKKYLLIGKPCDIGSLRNLQAMDERWKSVIPYTVAIFCAGIPSIKGTMELVQKIGLKGAATKIRYRGEGWPGMFQAWNQEGESVNTSYEKSWGETLNRHLHSRCKICPDGIGLQADFSIGDAWETQDGYPDFTNREGSSLVIVRTAIASELLDCIVRNGFIEITGQKDVGYLAAVQKFQAQRRLYFGYRILGWKLGGGMMPRFSGFSALENAFKGNFLNGIRQAIGTAKRKIKRLRKG